MDVGKILMGTAMILFTIGLFTHPAGANTTDMTSFVGQEVSIGNLGQISGNSTLAYSLDLSTSAFTTHLYERWTTQLRNFPIKDDIGELAAIRTATMPLPSEDFTSETS